MRWRPDPTSRARRQASASLRTEDLRLVDATVELLLTLPVERADVILAAIREDLRPWVEARLGLRRRLAKRRERAITPTIKHV